LWREAEERWCRLILKQCRKKLLTPISNRELLHGTIRLKN